MIITEKRLIEIGFKIQYLEDDADIKEYYLTYQLINNTDITLMTLDCFNVVVLHPYIDDVKLYTMEKVIEFINLFTSIKTHKQISSN